VLSARSSQVYLAASTCFKSKDAPYLGPVLLDARKGRERRHGRPEVHRLVVLGRQRWAHGPAQVRGKPGSPIARFGITSS
jgi:hypothetical protein